MMQETIPTMETLYCHVCGGELVAGGIGYSPYEYSCPVCLAAYHVAGQEAFYVTEAFVEHGAAPVMVPASHLRAPDHLRHAS